MDQPRRGPPSKLDACARDMITIVLAQVPRYHGDPVTIWTVADLTDLLGRHGYAVSPVTVNRTLHAMKYRYRRPRHDLACPPTSLRRIQAAIDTRRWRVLTLTSVTSCSAR